MTFGEALRQGADRLAEASVPEASLDAWYLLQACVRNTGVRCERSDFLLREKEELPREIQKQYDVFLSERMERKPLQYIIGETEFMGMPYMVNSHVLIPRQDTETLVELLCPFSRGKRVLDLCAGSGCIGLSIAVLGEPEEVVFSDVSPEAVRVAEQNARRLRKEKAEAFHSGTDFVCGDLFEKIHGTFDIIVSNPPYIESGVISGLMPEVRDFEPEEALDGGEDGLVFYRKIISQSSAYLRPSGMLWFEIGYNQGESVARLMEESGFTEIACRKDLAGKDRVVYGRKG